MLVRRSAWLIALIILALVGACERTSRATPPPQLTRLSVPTPTPVLPTPAPTTIDIDETNGEIDITRPGSLALEQEDIFVVEIRRERLLASLREPASRQVLLVESPPTASERVKDHAELAVLPFMSARLTANMEALEIRYGSPVLQSTRDTDHIFWTWQILAKTPGTYRVTLNILGQTEGNGLPQNILDTARSKQVPSREF